MKDVKISRSKIVIAIIILLILSVTLVFFFTKKKTNITYTYSNDEVIKEEIIDLEVNKIDEVVEEVVYDNMTLSQLSEKLERSLNSNISGYGTFIASYALEKGVDPYLATAIMLHETGCTWGCSSLVRNCNNVGGMKGTGCGQYAYFSSLEEGIQRFIDNIYNNYYTYGLTNADLMGNKYAEDPEWSKKVNGHIEKIKNR